MKMNVKNTEKQQIFKKFYKKYEKLRILSKLHEQFQYS